MARRPDFTPKTRAQIAYYMQLKRRFRQHSVDDTPAFDPDALAYITAVETADGEPLEAGVREAINSFVVGCKADGIWSNITQLLIFGAARTMSGVFVPAKGTAPTNVNFVTADYDRKQGLTGNGTTKRVATGILEDAFAQNDIHISAYVTAKQSATTDNVAIMGTRIGPSIALVSNASGTEINLRGRNRSPSLSVAPETGFLAPPLFMGNSRGSAANYTERYGPHQRTVTEASEGVQNNEINIFGRSDGEFDGRIFASTVGTNIDLAALRIAMDTFYSDIQGAIA